MDSLSFFYNDPMNERYAELALRLLLSVLAGALLGLDRESKNKPLGVRTYALISLGACGFAILAMELSTLSVAQTGVADIDPSRVLQGVIGGVGFLGAGAIFKSGDDVSGTATGAGIWAAGVVGLACGFGFYVFALLVLLSAWLVFAVLGAYLKMFAGKIEDQRNEREAKDAKEKKEGKA